ncbi:MAG TPA: hypothetical protein VNK82_06875 [Terriglobales bacterium]|nr:hypothetical protein [Terriglobales bacterium]
MNGSDSPGGSGGGLKIVLLAVAGLYILASLYLLFDMRGRIGTLEAFQATSSAAQKQLTERMESADARMKATLEALEEKLGITEKELEARTAELQRAQKAQAASLRQEQKAQMEAVSGQVESVKTEVGGVKTEVATTRTELEATKEKLERTIGDLGIQSGLIAKTREEVDELRRRGERNYYDFTLIKGQKPTPVATVSLQLKKADAKKSKFTLNVIADDRTIEKKDRTMLEPLQFYTGKDRQLYELVVFTVDKNKVVGYLSTPKGHIAKAQ